MKKVPVFFVLLFLFTMITASQTLTIKKVGEWGRNTYSDFYIKGNYAYCCCGSGGLDIIDISNPTLPKIVKNYNTGTDVKCIKIINNYAFLISGGLELQIVDISNPCTPVLIIGLKTFFHMTSLFVKDNYVYAVGSRRLKVLDISNLFAPSFLGEIEINGTPTSIVVKGNYAYVATSNYLMPYAVAGLHIIECIKNPIAPKLVGLYDAGD